MRLFLRILLLFAALAVPLGAAAQTNGQAGAEANNEAADEIADVDEEGSDEEGSDEDGSEQDGSAPEGSSQEDQAEQGPGDESAAEDGETQEAVDGPGDPFEDFGELGPARPDSGTSEFNGRPLELMTRSDLSDAGFDFGDESEGADTSTALLLSLTAGLAVHGIGHFHLGDQRTAWFILGMEGLGLGLMASAASYLYATGGANPATSFIRPAMTTGVALFFYSYLLDLVGVLHAGERRLRRNSSLNSGFGFQARYGNYGASGFPVRHVIDGLVALDLGGFYAQADTMQDVFLEGSAYGARVGVRPFRGKEPLTYLHVEGGGGYVQWQGLGEFGYFTADGRVGGSYQLGRLFPTIEEVALGAEIGLGHRWYQIAPRGSNTFELAHTELWVPYDVWASFNVSERLNVAVGYGSPDESFLASVNPLLGVSHVEFVYRGTSYGDISLRTELGDGVAVFLGGSLWFGR